MYYARYKHWWNNLEIKEIRNSYKYKFEHFHHRLHILGTNPSHFGEPLLQVLGNLVPSREGWKENWKRKVLYLIQCLLISCPWTDCHFTSGALSQGSWRAWVSPINSISGGTWGAVCVIPHWVAASLTGSAHTPLWSRLPWSQSLALILQELPRGLPASLSGRDKSVLHSQQEWSFQGNSDWAMPLFKNFQKFSR